MKKLIIKLSILILAFIAVFIFESITENKIEYVEVYVCNGDFEKGDFIDKENVDKLSIPKSLYHKDMITSDFSGYLMSNILTGSILYQSNISKESTMLTMNENMITIRLDMDKGNGFNFDINEKVEIYMIIEDQMIKIPARVIKLFNEKLESDDHLKYISFAINHNYVDIYYKNVDKADIYINKIKNDV